MQADNLGKLDELGELGELGTLPSRLPIMNALTPLGWGITRALPSVPAYIGFAAATCPRLFLTRRWLPASNGEVCTQFSSSRCHPVLDQCYQPLVRW